jgi:hypothetical protein
MTLKEAIELSLEVWRYLAAHPEIKRKWNLPKELYGKIEKMKACCPLCEYFIYNNRNCMRCPLSTANGISSLECGDDQHPFSVWNHAKNRKIRREAATAIVRLLEAALEKENRNEKSN